MGTEGGRCLGPSPEQQLARVQSMAPCSPVTSPSDTAHCLRGAALPFPASSRCPWLLASPAPLGQAHFFLQPPRTPSADLALS